MSSEDSGHVFIFHGDDDDDPRPSTTRSEVVVAGEQYERINHPDSMRETFSAAETKFIRMRSACLNRSIDREPNLPAHVWPDRVRGISTSRLRYVVRSLSRSAPIPEGTNQLQALSDICSVIWFLECDRSPFLGAAESILQNWKTERREALDAEVKWLTVVAFVLRRDDDLKAHLENLVWHSSAKLEFPIDYLQKWVNGRWTLFPRRRAGELIVVRETEAIP
ncbi:hypothetical protein GQ44DRAFT_82494 [Phaeosphaeriaceae sp. PMI808]|nr:hypothetical protein GQ44DRAFT_82494 [Phaeosphaeriaceae sp. PMI808]